MDQRKKIQDSAGKARNFFLTNATLSEEFRREQLISLERGIRLHSDEICAALYSDLHKSRYEAYMTEIGLVLGELKHTLKHLASYMKPRRVRTALAQLPGRAWVYSEPYGTVLIMSPWNYPFLLTMNPLIGAIAAGNCVVIKPSAYSAATSSVIKKIISECLPETFVSVIEGGRAENKALLNEQFDYIFFTGSPSVGHTVMEAAAKHLTPMTLELGGKSPVIIDASADIIKTARRVLFGKTLNAGQTCIAPDYVCVEKSIKSAFIEELKHAALEMFSDKSYYEEAFPHIVSEHHFERINALIRGQSIVAGGGSDPETRRIDFTILDEPANDSPVMTEEIFGPVLPITVWTNADELIAAQRAKPKPLALYLFSRDKAFVKRILAELSFGGGCVNDTIMHISSPYMPFGGVGNSGMGAYHGSASFDTFSHKKSILKKSWYFDLPLRYHPYKNRDAQPPEFIFKR